MNTNVNVRVRMTERVLSCIHRSIYVGQKLGEENFDEFVCLWIIFYLLKFFTSFSFG